jgi:hypothetical protein
VIRGEVNSRAIYSKSGLPENIRLGSSCRLYFFRDLIVFACPKICVAYLSLPL